TGPLGVTVTIAAVDSTGALMMQVSQNADVDNVSWQPLRKQFFWAWNPTWPRQIYVRLRDMAGNVSAIQRIGLPAQIIYLPVIRQ
ncbi:MAG: hypothetical protein HGA19_13665, partial [Oscillochloris sp.]|nr:hypothetical protein [Oscillochloris sp.]